MIRDQIARGAHGRGPPRAPGWRNRCPAFCYDLDHTEGEATMPGFIHEFDMHAEVTPDDVGVGPFGHRRIANITSGYVSGARLNGTIAGAGADWMLRGTDGFGRIDARLTVR